MHIERNRKFHVSMCTFIIEIVTNYKSLARDSIIYLVIVKEVKWQYDMGYFCIFTSRVSL